MNLGRKLLPMKIKRYLKSLFTKSPSKKVEHHKKRKVALFWHKFIKILTIKLVVLLVGLLFFFLIGAAFAQAPLHALIDNITKPKPITQSAKVLPSGVQQAIVAQAKQDIKEEQANALLTTTTSTSTNNTSPAQNIENNPSLAENIIDAIQEVTTTDPIVRAKIRIKRIDGLIAKLQNLLASNRSDDAIDQAVNLIEQIGQQTGRVANDPKVQTDREILTFQIKQYNRLQLILQKIEDQLPMSAYIKIEDARQKYLVTGAQASLNAAPNLQIVNNIGLAEVRSLVGEDFGELKAMEILSDLGDGLTPKTQQKLNVLQKQLALQFEKRMLTIPQNVRTKKLQDLHNSFVWEPAASSTVF